MAKRTRIRKLLTTLSLLGGCGYLMSGPGTGCSSFVAEAALAAADTSFIFDCQNGVLGGTFDLAGVFTDCRPATTGP